MTWSHIELGGAHYTACPETDSNDLPPSQAPRKNRYTILFNTVDKLIESKGKTGVFYLNDLHTENINYALDSLKNHIEIQHPDADIKLIPFTGDFFKIKLPVVDSIHLKNPEYTFFTALDEKANQNRLQYFADHAREGLTLATYFKRPFLHRLERLGVGYKIMNTHFEPYRHTNGQQIDVQGNVIEFSVKSLATIKSEHLQDYLTIYTCRRRIHPYTDIYGKNCLRFFFSGNLTDPDFIPDNRNELRAKL